MSSVKPLQRSSVDDINDIHSRRSLTTRSQLVIKSVVQPYIKPSMVVLWGVLMVYGLFGSSLSHAQQAVHHIEIGVGSLSNLAKDNLAAPARYRGGGAPFTVAYRAEKRRFRHLARISYSQTGFAARSLERTGDAPFGRAEYVLAQWQYAYQRNIWSNDTGNFELWGGPIWYTTAHVREYFYTQINSEITWEVFSSVGAQIDAAYHVSDRSSISLDLRMPLVSYVNRPPYAVEGDDVFYALFKRSEFLKLGEVVSWGEFVSFSTRLSYRYAFTERLGARLSYSTLLYRYRKPLTTAAVLREVQFSISLTL